MPLLTSHTTVLIQGITGKEGQRGLAFMRATGTQVVAGVTPGKGGQDVEGTPVYNSVAEALAAHPSISATSIVVPPQFTLSAVKEALTAGLTLIHIFTEGVPVRDTAQIVKLAREKKARVFGPSSIGLIVPGVAKLGLIGSDHDTAFTPVPDGQTGVAILSKSGGMTNETAALLSNAGIPQSFAFGTGGDRLVGTTFADLLPDLAKDPKTEAVVIIGEIGGSYEEELAEAITVQKFPKKVVAFISGLFAETLPQGVSFGHAGAIVSKTEGTRQGKIDALKTAGVLIADSPEDLVTLLEWTHAT